MQVSWHPPSIPYTEGTDRFTVRRVYCIGRNYRAHTLEMGGKLTDEPFFFCKTSDCVTPCLGPQKIAYPPMTSNLQHELELVVGIGSAGYCVTPAQAATMIAGYAVGIDFTRRDLQLEAKEKRRPWSTSKNFSNAAPVSAMTPFEAVGVLEEGDVTLHVNGQVRQQANLAQLIWPVTTIISQLSKFDLIKPGDLIFTGTPSGVSKVNPGDHIQGSITDLTPLDLKIDHPLPASDSE
jgi:fumarylpyruvate hydrolase